MSALFEADLITRVDGFQADFQVCLANAGGNEDHVLPIVDKAEFVPAVDFPFVGRSLGSAGHNPRIHGVP